ncbi:hypothetical protein TNCV_4157471 [Trichonephila clavipes]|nr:hypothetical protein TNCV_4157471 [Trichonephila clavipes]
MQVTVRFVASFHSNFEGGHLEVVKGLPPTTREDLRLDGYLEYPHAAKALDIYKHPCLLRDSSPVPMESQSDSLTTILVGRLS